MYLSTRELNPVVLDCRYFDGYALEAQGLMEARTAAGYELEYFIKSDGGVWVDGRFQPFRAGELSVRRPGQLVQEVAPYSAILLTVDLAGDVSPRGGGGSNEGYENPLVDQLPDRMVLQKPAVIAGIMDRIFRDHLAGGELAYFRAKASLYQLFAELFAEVAAQSTSGSTLQIRKSIAFIRENLTEPLQVEKLVAESGLSRSAFHRQFKQETGLTPGQFLSFLRIDQAKRLLSTTDKEVGEIAACCGFSDSNYFSRVFRRATGLTPTAFRQGVGIGLLQQADGQRTIDS